MKTMKAILLSLSCLITSHVIAELPFYVGPVDRFWRHNKDHKTIKIDGVEQYHHIEACIDSGLTMEDRQLISTIPQNRTIGNRIIDGGDNRNRENEDSTVIFVEVLNAITPVHAKAVQVLAACIREHAPSLFEKRPMYLEFGLDEDESLGGNSPTHMAPLLSIFFPEIKEDMMRTVKFAYDEANWVEWTIEDELKFSRWGPTRAMIHPEPNNLGFRASEHLTYSDFPSLGDHVDGEATAYTLNFALSDPEDYEGGFLYLYDSVKKKTSLKPSKYSACVFLGGLYMHGVTEITGGHREMFSSELWFNPDVPIGASLWTSTPETMEEYIWRCNRIGHEPGEPCLAAFPDVTANGISVNDNRAGKFLDNDFEDAPEKHENYYSSYSYWDNEERFPPKDVSFLSFDEEPHFLVPANASVGEIFPLYFRETGERVKDDEALGIALPPELHEEFKKYIEANGMLSKAREIIYEGERFANNEHRLYKLDDNMTWGCKYIFFFHQ